MNYYDETVIVQLWHAPGAFKRFGFDVVSDENIKKLLKLSGSKIDYLVTSSKNLSKIYQDAFAVDESKILPVGTPRMDFYFEKDKNNKINIKNIRNIRAKFEEKYPEIKEKKIILYAPTFRESEELNNDISRHFDFNLFKSYLGNEYVLFFKSHPNFKIVKIKGSIDVSNHVNLQELLLITDVLITDYSSIMIEYSVLSKPIIFYPFDLEYYISNERGFYFDYNNVPGPIAKNTEDIVKIIKGNDFDFEKINNFANDNFDYLDANSSKRIVDNIFK
jgi:CDP-ribitol ribitolphosphotransferase